jgi:hypothetical protein
VSYSNLGGGGDLQGGSESTSAYINKVANYSFKEI